MSYFGAFRSVLQQQKPDAVARVRGSTAYPNLFGEVRFYETGIGVLVVYSFSGLPSGLPPCQEKILAMHIHTGGTCTGTAEDPFADTGTHYNPGSCAHPNHAGDLPPLFSNRGFAFGSVFTDRFSISEVLGKTVIVHAGMDDFTTQPSGNAGAKIACGVIVQN